MLNSKEPGFRIQSSKPYRILTIKKIYYTYYITLYIKSSTSSANTYYKVTTFELEEMIWNIRNWMCQEWNMTFPQSKNKSVIVYVFRIYDFVSGNFC